MKQQQNRYPNRYPRREPYTPKAFFCVDPEIMMVMNYQMAEDLIDALEQAREMGELKGTVHSFSCMLKKRLDEADMDDVPPQPRRPRAPSDASVASYQNDDPEGDEEEEWDEEGEEE